MIRRCSGKNTISDDSLYSFIWKLICFKLESDASDDAFFLNHLPFADLFFQSVIFEYSTSSNADNFMWMFMKSLYKHKTEFLPALFLMMLMEEEVAFANAILNIVLSVIAAVSVSPIGVDYDASRMAPGKR